ncbi:TonB-dependent receptor [Paraburkholderia fungorum]|jgi:outer membrane receptor protein involved in Fe transport|uniref:TonB-dependent receptor n=1 Tax=Paraburkholderia fungorum TaxID=134537 RepID=A0AAP5QHF5_9BURK|nr:TonB-dependent receptor [Paraburkholderia fungorum]MDT8843561.1 TonB-dependent receptor [Paraburkholderia fungorum]
MATVARDRRRPSQRRAVALTSALLCAGGYLPDAIAGGIQEPAPSDAASLPAITVTAGSISQAQAVGDSASEGYVPRDQILSRPLLRPGELLEAVPGLIVTQHSGDGKANQYFLRGFNLDHGTDLATAFNGMPANMRTNAHGQGYTDLNFVMPELVNSIAYKKGPYFANEGDFATAGAVDIEYVDSLPQGIASVELGSHAYRRGVLANSNQLGPGTLLYGFEWQTENGPWQLPEGVHKFNGVLRYTMPLGGGEKLGVTAMAYRNAWNSTDQVPQRAINSGLIGRFGNIDPTDGGYSSRYSLSTDWYKPLADGAIKANAYVIKSRLQLFSDFTYFLNDPAHGDQFEQYENRVTTGANVERTWFSSLLGRDSETSVGFQTRYDRLDPISLANTEARGVIGNVSIDTLNETSAAIYVQNSTQWLPWLRTLAGLRADQFWYNVSSELTPANSGSGSQHILSPKFSLILSPTRSTDVFFNYGRGYHSNDVRGATTTVDPATGDPLSKVDVLVPGTGYEIGVKTTTLVPGLQLSASLWQLDLASELVYSGDTGTTEPSRPSRRRGVELAAYYKPTQYITFDVDGAWSHARFSDDDPVGNYIPEAIQTTASAGLSIEHEQWSLGARMRYFGPRPLIEDNSQRSGSSFLVNLKLGYRVAKNVHVFAEVLNVFNRKADDIDYYYASLLRGEVSPVDANGQPTGITDHVIHPAEPRELRVGMVFNF